MISKQMKKHKFYSILGLLSTCIILINYLIFFAISEYGLLSNEALLLISLFSMFSGLILFISLRFIIVIYSKMDEFRIVLLILIISQILTSILTLLIKYQAFPLMYIVIPLIIFGFILAGSYLWFFILLSKTEDKEIKGLPFLLYFGITLLAMVILAALFSIIPYNGIKTFDSIIQLLEAFPYVFIFLFFIRHIRLSRLELKQNTYA